MTKDELNAIAQRHGGYLSQPVVVDPQIDNPDPNRLPSDPAKIPNPNPTYRYVLKDGTEFQARATEQGGSDFQIIDPGTAVKPLTPADRLPSPTGQLEKIDAQGNLIPPTDTTTRAAKLRDPSTGAVTDLPDPKSSPEGTLKEFGDQLLNIKPDGSYTVVATKSKDPSAQQAKSTFDGPDGARYEYDPNKPEGQRMTKLLEGKPEKPTVTAASNIIWQDIPDQPGKQQGGTVVEGKFVPTEGLVKDKDAKPVAVYGTGQNDRWRISLDEKGNVVSKEENPNYTPQPGTQLTADAAAANIPILKPDGSVAWVPNQNRVPVGQAMADLMQQAGLKVNAGELSMDDAKNMLTGAVNLMNARTSAQTAQNAQDTTATTAAQNIITNEQTQRTQGAQTGAGMLNQRVQAAQGMLGQVLGLANGGQRSGNMGGGLMNAPAGLGEALIGGIGGWTAELGGGQGVYDAAARMVTAADPQNGRSPEAQAAYGVLTQMLERYQQQAGQPHPAVIATQAANQSQQANGMVAPQLPAPAGQMLPWNNGQPSATGAPMIAGATPFMNAGTRYYGNGGLPPDQPFVAPVTVAL